MSNKFIAYYTNSIFKKDLAAKAEIMPVFSNMLANMPGIKHVLLLISHYAISLVSRGVQDPADIGTCANGLPPRVQDPFWVRMRKVLSNDFFNTNLWCQDCLVKNLITLVDFDSLLVLVDSKWKAIWHSLLSQYYEWLSQYQVLKILRNYNIISWSSFIVTLTIVCIWYASVRGTICRRRKHRPPKGNLPRQGRLRVLPKRGRGQTRAAAYPPASSPVSSTASSHSCS